MFEETEEVSVLYKNTRGRAWRRKQNKRIEKRAFKKFKAFDNSYWDADNKSHKNDLLWEKARFEKDVMKRCSCFMCGNPRFHWGEITIKEKIFKDIEKSQDY